MRQEKRSLYLEISVVNKQKEELEKKVAVFSNVLLPFKETLDEDVQQMLQVTTNAIVMNVVFSSRKPTPCRATHYLLSLGKLFKHQS